MRHVAVLLVFSLKFTHVKMKGPNKSINLTLSKSFILFKTKPIVRTREYTNVTNKLFDPSDVVSTYICIIDILIFHFYTFWRERA